MTDLFVCEQCGNVDSIHATQQLTPGFKCHRCTHGTWHGMFEEKQWDPNDPTPMLNRTGPGVSFS